MIAMEGGGYEPASDYDEETLALITREEHGGVIEAGLSRSFDEMITFDLVETTLTIRLQTCTTLRLSNR